MDYSSIILICLILIGCWHYHINTKNEEINNLKNNNNSLQNNLEEITNKLKRKEENFKQEKNKLIIQLITNLFQCSVDEAKTKLIILEKAFVLDDFINAETNDLKLNIFENAQKEYLNEENNNYKFKKLVNEKYLPAIKQYNIKLTEEDLYNHQSNFENTYFFKDFPVEQQLNSLSFYINNEYSYNQTELLNIIGEYRDLFEQYYYNFSYEETEKIFLLLKEYYFKNEDITFSYDNIKYFNEFGINYLVDIFIELTYESSLFKKDKRNDSNFVAWHFFIMNLFFRSISYKLDNFKLVINNNQHLLDKEIDLIKNDLKVLISQYFEEDDEDNEDIKQ